MREVISNRLWVGNSRDARDPPRWLELGVRALVDLAIEETPCSPVRETLYFRVPLLDGSGNSPATLQTAVDVTVSLVRRATPTLVCCSGGMSRSPAVVAAALSVIQRCPPDECLREIVAGHSHDVSPIFWHELKQAIHSGSN